VGHRRLESRHNINVPRLRPVMPSHLSGQDVIMLAAAANHGGNKRIAFPANLHSMVLGVNSTDGLGNPSPFTPSPDSLRENFSVLGEVVNSQWPKKLGGPKMRKAGTSFATPITAGIAATLLHYAKVKFPGFETFWECG
jgi:subtilase family serine protease